jgi:hypothetical protein
MKINKGYLAEVNLTTVSIGQRYNFQDIPQLRYNEVVIEGLEVVISTGLIVSPNLNTVINATGVKSIVLTLVVSDSEEIYQIPLSTLVASLNSGLIRELNEKRINIVKSYITVLSTAGLTAAESVIVYFYYKPLQIRK